MIEDFAAVADGLAGAAVGVDVVDGAAGGLHADADNSNNTTQVDANFDRLVIAASVEGSWCARWSPPDGRERCTAEVTSLSSSLGER